MNLTIKKTIETGDIIEIKTPSFYRFTNQLRMITEKNVIAVLSDSIIVYDASDYMFKDYVKMSLQCEKVTEVEFLEKLFDVQDKINEACGVSSIPTIFTQNNFRSFQKPLL